MGGLEGLCDGVISPEWVNALTDEQIKSIGTSSSKVIYIRSLMMAVKTVELLFEDLAAMPDVQVI